MGKNRNKRTRRRKSSSPKPTTQAVRPPSIRQRTDPPPKPGFHIDWTRINTWQFLILFFAPLLITIVVVVPILNGLHHLRPEAAVIADPFVTLILVVTGVLAAGIIKIRQIDLFDPQKFRPKQAILALVSGVILSLLLLAVAIPPPSNNQLSSKPPPAIISKTNACQATPILTAPTDGQTLNSRKVILTWEAPPGCVPDGYTVRISADYDPEAKPWIVDTGWAPTDYSYTLTEDGTYYWHIRACKPCTPFHPGNWAIRTFTIRT